MAPPRMLVILADDTVPDAVRQLVQRSHATAQFWPANGVHRRPLPSTTDLFLVVAPTDPTRAIEFLNRLLVHLAEHARPTLVLTGGGQLADRVDYPPALPVAFADADRPQELAIQFDTLLALRRSFSLLHRGAVANRRAGHSAARRYTRQLRLASQVQRQFLPDELPRIGNTAFDVAFCPVDYVSGDIYDVHRLDEEHVGIAVADATGHGIPAALLTVYIKRALRGKEIENGTYRILAPDEVLTRLNDDILDARLAESQFVATAYAVLNVRTLALSVARGGAPYPLIRRADGRIEVIDPPGSVVGVLPEARFETAHVQLEPGDSVLLYTDGLERIVAPQLAGDRVPAALARSARKVARVSRLTRAAVSATQAATPAFAQAETGVATLTADDSSVATLTGDGDDDAELVAGATHVHTLSTTDPNLPAHELITSSHWCETLRKRGPRVALEQARGRQRMLRRLGYPLDDLTVVALYTDVAP